MRHQNRLPRKVFHPPSPSLRSAGAPRRKQISRIVQLRKVLPPNSNLLSLSVRLLMLSPDLISLPPPPAPASGPASLSGSVSDVPQVHLDYPFLVPLSLAPCLHAALRLQPPHLLIARTSRIAPLHRSLHDLVVVYSRRASTRMTTQRQMMILRSFLSPAAKLQLQRTRESPNPNPLMYSLHRRKRNLHNPNAHHLFPLRRRYPFRTRQRQCSE